MFRQLINLLFGDFGASRRVAEVERQIRAMGWTGPIPEGEEAALALWAALDRRALTTPTHMPTTPKPEEAP